MLILLCEEDMMNLIKATGEKTIKDQTVTMTNRSKLVLTGIDKVKSVNDHNVVIAMPETTLVISGASLQVNQLNVNDGTIEIVGTISKLDYQTGLLKKLIK